MEELKTAVFRSARNLPDLCAEFFALIVGLRRAIQFDNADQLRSKITRAFSSMKKEGLRRGIPEEELKEAQYILTAFIDETILISRWPHRDDWQDSPLQLEYFETFVAGEEVFDKLDKVRQNAAAKAELLEVYYSCLALGFQGRMSALPDGDQRLRTLLDEVWRDLQRVKTGEALAFAPAAIPTDRVAPKRGKDLDMRIVAAAFVGTFLILILLLNLILGGSGGGVARSLTGLL